MLFVVSSNSVKDNLAITETLIVDTRCEELVKVKMILDEEADVTGFKLEGFGSKDF